MKRIAIIVQRYGIEINGGAELHARLLCQALSPYYQVEILTSRALDYQVWDRHYPAGEQWVEGCRVLRFDHPPRDRSRRKYMPLQHKLRFKLRRILAWLGIAPVAKPSGHDGADGLRYLRAQGPTMDGLIGHLRAHAKDYQALIFFTARFHPTALGIFVDPARSILVPTLHDEKTMVLPHFHRVFRAPSRIMYNTRAEASVAQRLYGVDIAPGEVCGVGIHLGVASDSDDADRDRRWMQTVARLRIDAPYLLYVGRIDAGKGCGEMFDYFARLPRHGSRSLKLVVCGRLSMPRPEHADIILAGFVSEVERDDLIVHASALIVPSRHESLSLVLLESLALGCPVLVNWHSEVLRQHVQDSGVGQTYRNFAEFDAAVDRLAGQDGATRLEQADQGRRYVREHYDWSRIIAKFRSAIEDVGPEGGGSRP